MSGTSCSAAITVEFDTGHLRIGAGQSRVPPGAGGIHPVVERYRYIWIWPGDAHKADPDLIPDYHWNDDPTDFQHRIFSCRRQSSAAGRQPLDLSHVQFVHATTLGADGVSNAPLDTRREDDKVRIDRWIMDKPPPAMFAGAGNFPGNVDRWQLITWTAPTHVVIDAGCANAGTGARDGNRAEGITVYSITRSRPKPRNPATISGTTRATTASTIQTSRNSLQRLPAPPLGRRGYLAAQQRSIDSAKAEWRGIDINADAGVLQARRVIDKMLAAE